MRFIFSILFLVGVLAGTFYYFFHDTPLWKNFFPDHSVNINQPVKNIAIEIIGQKRKDIGRSLNQTDMRDAYLQALDAKYYEELSVDEYWAHLKDAKAKWFKQKDGNGDSVLSKAEHDAAFPNRVDEAKAFAEQLDSNGNNYLDESEWRNAKFIFQSR